MAHWFTTLLANHNDPDCDFHLDMYEPFIIGKGLNPGEDIVYMNISFLYFLCNIFRNIECGWLFQLNGDVTYGINRTGVASLTLGVTTRLGTSTTQYVGPLFLRKPKVKLLTGIHGEPCKRQRFSRSIHMLFVGVGATHAEW